MKDDDKKKKEEELPEQPEVKVENLETTRLTSYQKAELIDGVNYCLSRLVDRAEGFRGFGKIHYDNRDLFLDSKIMIVLKSILRENMN